MKGFCQEVIQANGNLRHSFKKNQAQVFYSVLLCSKNSLGYLGFWKISFYHLKAEHMT